MATSVKQRIECFKNSLPTFLKQQEEHKQNRKLGVRPAKNNKNGTNRDFR